MTLPPIPDRVALDPQSPFYWPHWEVLGVRLNDAPRHDVREFCMSEGWIKIGATKSDGALKLERGRPVLITIRGKVEPFFRRPIDLPPAARRRRRRKTA